jgi:hypothetical protein
MTFIVTSWACVCPGDDQAPSNVTAAPKKSPVRTIAWLADADGKISSISSAWRRSHVVSMAPEQVLERLWTMSLLSVHGESPMPYGVDMSPRAVEARLREMAELNELCHVLGTGRIKVSR